MKYIEIDWLKKMIIVQHSNGTWQRYYHLSKSRYVWLCATKLKRSDLSNIKTFFWIWN